VRAIRDLRQPFPSFCIEIGTSPFPSVLGSSSSASDNFADTDLGDLQGCLPCLIDMQSLVRVAVHGVLELQRTLRFPLAILLKPMPTLEIPQLRRSKEDLLEISHALGRSYVILIFMLECTDFHDWAKSLDDMI